MKIVLDGQQEMHLAFYHLTASTAGIYLVQFFLGVKKKNDYSSLKMLMNSKSYSNWLYIVDSKCKLESKAWKKKSYWFFSICYSFKCLTSLDSTFLSNFFYFFLQFLSKFYARIDNSANVLWQDQTKFK